MGGQPLRRQWPKSRPGKAVELLLRIACALLEAIGLEYVWYDGGGTEIRFRGHKLVRSPWGEHWNFNPPKEAPDA